MARGRQRGRGQKRKHGLSRQDQLNKRQKSHLKEFGEEHPANDRISKQKFKKFEDISQVNEHVPVRAPVIESSSSESEEEASAYQELLTTFGSVKNIESDEGSSTEENEDGQNNVDTLAESSASAVKESQETRDMSSEGLSGVDDLDTDSESDGEQQDHAAIEESEMLDDDDYRTECLSGDEDGTELIIKENDPFSQHCERDIPDDLVENLSKASSWEKVETEIPVLGRCFCSRPKDFPQKPPNFKEKDLRKIHVKKSISDQAALTNKKYSKANIKEPAILTKLQQSLFTVMNNYQDLCYNERNYQNGEEIRLAYCLHAVNHVLKTRSRVIAHNTKIKSKSDDIPDGYRDQGLTRPKVLMVLPFRDSALKVVNIISSLLMPAEQSFVSNKKRFQKEYSVAQEVEHGKKPEDFEATFEGNTDDHFRIGLGVAKKSLKLYTPFYSSDIILASPLGLRTIIGVEGEKERDYDFLSSIELLMFDQMDMFMMQNWDHILHLMSHLHLQPQESHGVDFSRVRMWTLNGWSKFYRQTLIFSGVVLPEINSIFNKHCHNYAGKLYVNRGDMSGSICHIITPLPQMFHRLAVNSYADIPEARFEFFKNKILSQYKDVSMKGTLIFIPSYYDFVRLRNYFKKEELSFQKLCEYTVDKSITRARSFFYHGRAQFLLFTERLHFFRRFRIRGIRHIIFYDLPTYSHFYSEIANMIIDPKRKKKMAQNFTCEVLYTKYDVHKLAAIVGSERATKMLSSEKTTHMFMTGDT